MSTLNTLLEMWRALPLQRSPTVPLRKKLACNWRSELSNDYTCIRTPYVQDAPTERTNVSKFGHKEGDNCLCILPQTIYLRKAVLLNNFAI